MPIFVLFTDIDKNSKLWHEWIPYNSNDIYKTDFVDQLKKIGKVYIPEPNFVNFRKWAKYDKNKGYGSDIYFSIDDLKFENYTDWVYDQIKEEDRNNIIVIGFEQGNHLAKYFCNKYSDNCLAAFILGDRILTKKNYEKVLNDAYYDSLKKIFGNNWEDYTVDNMTNAKLNKILDDIKLNNNQDYVDFINGFIKLYIRSQYNKIKEALVPMYIYTYKNIQTNETKQLHEKFKEISQPIHVEYYYLDDNAPYFIYGKYKDNILAKIKSIIGMTGGYYNKYIKYKIKYLNSKKSSREITN